MSNIKKTKKGLVEKSTGRKIKSPMDAVVSSSECWMESKHHQCCCQCRHHIPDFYHCTIDTKLREEMEKCVCGIQKGWICIPPEFDGRAYSEWPEHSIGCEMYDKKNAKGKRRGFSRPS